MVYAPLQLGGIRGWEWIIIVFVILLLFGSKKIPELARSVGKALGEFERGRRELEQEIKKAAEAPAETPTPTTYSVPTSERGRVEKVAEALGISPEGKTIEQLRQEIFKAIEKKEDS